MRAIVFLLLLVQCYWELSVSFTCNVGRTYEAALTSCTDGGVQKHTIGGNVSIMVHYATNLPNRDSSGPAAGVSDPYVKFTVGGYSAQTKDVRNSLNPHWNEMVNIGYLASATAITVEIWDKDNGLEFSDDILVRSTLRVPFCSTFMAPYDEVRCGGPFGCESDDSSWHMPRRQQCNETGAINFGRRGVDLYVTVYLVPFVMEDLLDMPGQLRNARPPTVSAVAASASARLNAPWTIDEAFGYPYLNDLDTRISVNSAFMTDLVGGLMFVMSNTEKSLGKADSIKFYAGVNFPATMYVCRFEEDDEVGVPNWLKREYRRDMLHIRRLIIANTLREYGCYYQHVPGTVKNKYGGVVSGAIPLRANTLPGLDSDSATDRLRYAQNYIALAIPHVLVPPQDQVIVRYDSGAFVSLSLSYGLICAWFVFLIARFLNKIDYRIDRVSNYLASRVLTGDEKNILASLFVCYGQSPHNIEFRAHMFHARNIIYFVVAMPFVLLISWGFSSIAVVRPKALGLAVAFLGVAGLFFWFGIALWRRSHWRSSPISMISLGLSSLFFLFFLFGSVFLDVGVVEFGYDLNFTALGLIFGAFNCVPLMFLAFKQDRSQTRNLQMVVQRMAEAIFSLKNPNAKVGEYKDLKINRILHALLGENYTINPKVPAFKYSAALFELAEETNDADADGNLDETEVEEGKKAVARRLYGISLGMLLIYFIIVAARTTLPSLAFLNCLALVLLDIIHLSMSHGDTKWNPGFMIALLIAGRVLIMGSPPSLWMLNYGACYALYGCLLSRELINSYLPMLSKREAGEIAFSGVHNDLGPNPDIAGTAYFNLILLTCAYTAVLVVAAFGVTDGALPTPDLKVLGWEGWNVTVFGLLAILVSAIGTLLFATSRAYYLDSHGLLRGRLKEIFFLRPSMTLPRILALATEFTILVTGFLVYASTGSPAMLVGCIYLPIIAVCFGLCWRAWVKNDYELIVWPRQFKHAAAHVEGEDASDLEVAFNLIEDLFGGPSATGVSRGSPAKRPQSTSGAGYADGIVVAFAETAEGDTPESLVERGGTKPKTLKNFQLPELKVTGNKVDEIKMPPLPLKSVLRKKRQNLGIKTKMPLVKDLRARDDAVDNDKFGNSADVIDATDPWAQFELNEEEEKEARRAEIRAKKKAVTTTVAKREPIWKHKYVLTTLKALKACIAALQSAYASARRLVVGNKVHPGDKYGLGDDDSDDEEPGSPDGILPGSGPGAVKSVKKSTKAKPGATSATPKTGGNQEDLEKGGDEHDEDGALLEVDVNSLQFDQAMWGGYLNTAEYSLLAAWYGGLFMVMMFGVTLSLSCQPAYIGEVIWVAMITFICTMVPIIKYFNTYTFDDTMWQLVRFVMVLHFLFCLIFFVAFLEGDVGHVGTLWIFDYFIYYPLFLYIAFEVYRWYDSGFKFIDLDMNHDGRISLREALNYIRATPVLICGVIMFNWQLYVWINPLVGEIVTLLLIIAIIAYIYFRDWAMNDFYLSPELLILGGYGIKLTLFITFCVSFFGTDNPILPLSVFCFTLMFERCLAIGQRIAVDRVDSIFFFSPFVMPVYSYDAQKQDVVDESQLALNVFYALMIGVVWGCFMAVFYYPVNIGVALACCFLLTIFALTSLAVSTIPQQLAKASAMLTPEGIVECANAAKEKFADRKLPINLEMQDWEHAQDVKALDNGEVNAVGQRKTALDKLKDRTALNNAVDLIADVRALKYVREEKIVTETEELADVDEYELKWYQQLWVDAKARFKELIEMVPLPKHTGWKKHSQGTFGFRDAAMELLILGKGPWGFAGLDGMWYRFLMSCRDSPRWEKFYPKFLDHYDDAGVNLDYVQLTEDMDLRGVLARVRDLDESVDFTYHEETRCAVHFILMLLVGADVKLQREQVLFQKFLRENRFRLASNGITPPPDIFSSSSFASINIPLVAAWLNTLTQDEKERFHALKATFSTEQRERDELIDTSDYEIAFQAIKLQNERKARDKFWIDKFTMVVARRKEQRLQEFIESLQGFERQKFGQRRDLWMNDPECFVDLKEMDLYERFRAAYLAERNDAVESMQQAFIDIETAQKDARLGEYGRAYQFVDSEFMPSDASIGDGQGSASVLGWRCAPGIVEEAMLFDGGTHPDEVHEGVFRDTWLLSAINMVVAAGEFGNGIINSQIKGLFVSHTGPDGEPTLQTEVGAYCVQIFRNGEWTPIIVDDLFPMRKKDAWTNENRGMACAHTREVKGLWLSLVEKAFAKYYGSYAMLEQGYVHHALQDLTGCEAKCIPLSGASRGVGKRALWDNLVRFRQNGYILGAGTGDSHLVDKEIQDMGIVFDSAYTIYDVRQVNGHRLIKLRNPPGDHDEWKGDWSDKSPLWTRKLKRKLGHSDAVDNTFFMSFDDFCNVFRNLYVCKYYNPLKWYEIAHPGVWKKSDEDEVEKQDVLNHMMSEATEQNEVADIHTTANDRKRARARIDSAGGLPTKHNPGCVLENNPYYSFRVNRPTDFRVSVTQYSFKGRASLVIHPFSILLVKNRDNHHPVRLETLVKEDVVFSTGEPRAERTINLYGSGLAPGLYVVLVGAYMQGMEGQFKISVLTNHKTEFTPIWPPLWLLKGEREKAEEGGVAGESLAVKDERAQMISKSAKSNKARRGGDLFGMRAGLKNLFGTGDGEEDDDSSDEES